MSVSKIKNLILLILAMAVGFLLILVIPSKTAQAREEAALYSRLETLYEGCGVQLSGDSLPTSVRLYTVELESSRADESAAVNALLGTQAAAEDDTVRYSSVYSSEFGTCSLKANGSFTAALSGALTASDPVSGTKRILRSMGFRAASVSAAVRSSAGVYRVTAYQQILGAEVFSDGLSFTYTNGALTAVDGVYFPGSTVTRVSEEACISCADALVALLASRDSLGWVGSRILSVRQGYQHFETASAAVRLVPVWRIGTDTGSFLVNGITREVTAIESGSSAVS